MKFCPEAYWKQLKYSYLSSVDMCPICYKICFIRFVDCDKIGVVQNCISWYCPPFQRYKWRIVHRHTWLTHTVSF